jgi:hypothetical protein
MQFTSGQSLGTDICVKIFKQSLSARKDSALLVIREGKIRTQGNSTFYSLGWLLSDNTKQKIRNVIEDVRKLQPLYTADGNVKLCNYCREHFDCSSKSCVPVA